MTAPLDPARLDDPDAIAALLRGTALERAAVSETMIAGTEESAIVVQFAEPTLRSVPWAEVFAAWSAARALLPQTGRWPVAAPLGDAPLFHRGGYREWNHTPADDHLLLPQALLREAAATHPSIDDIAASMGLPSNSPNATLEQRTDNVRRWAEYVRDRELRVTEAWVGSAPSLEDILREVELENNFQLERWLFDWEEARCPTTASSARDEALDVYPTSANAIVLLPVDEPWKVGAYMHYYGGGEGRSQQLPYLSRLATWDRRYGIEVLVSDGLVLTCRLTRPPTEIDAAYDLALEINRYNLGDASPRQVARFLLGNAEPWSLYSRP